MIAEAIQTVGNIVEGFGSFQASRARAAALRGAAKQARQDGSMQAQMATDEAERAGASAAVIGAANGGGFGGSFSQVLADLEQTGVFNARSAIHAGNAEAANRTYESQVAKQEGNMALLTSAFKSAGTIAGGHMRQAEQKKQTPLKYKLETLGRRG